MIEKHIKNTNYSRRIERRYIYENGSTKKADKTYRYKKLNDGTKKQINATLNISDYVIIDDYCKARGISKAALITRAIKYCIANNIELTAAEQDSGNASDSE